MLLYIIADNYIHINMKNCHYVSITGNSRWTTEIQDCDNYKETMKNFSGFNVSYMHTVTNNDGFAVNFLYLGTEPLP